MVSQPTSALKSSMPELSRLSSELKGLQAERLKRERAKNDLLTFASVIEIPGAPQSIDSDEREHFTPIKTAFAAHHVLWIDCLQKIEDGKIKRLIGLLPPGSAKSTYTSVVLPTHFLGRFPGKKVIISSYGDKLPKKFGRRARSIVNQPIFKRIFDCQLSQESGAVDEWMLTNGSEFMAAGILTGITGNRVDLIVWDDLIKGRQEADSETTRQKTWDAYLDDLQTRRKPNTVEVGVTTRWHEDDVAGRILPSNYNGESGWVKGQDGNDWYVVCLPAECERSDDLLGRKIGERLWPEYFTEEHFAPYKRYPRTWSALFQQRPAPEEGNFFLAEWLKPYGPQKDIKLPNMETLTRYGASDYAVTADGGDYTVHLVVGVDPKQRIFLLDLWRGRTSSDQWAVTLCDMIKKWKPVGWAEEKGQITAGVGPFITQEMRNRNAFVYRKGFPARGDKRTRAQSIQGRMAMDGLYVPEDAPWYPEFKRELMVFDAGRHDDQVDALSLVGQILDVMIQGHPVDPSKERPKVLSTDRRFCTVTLDDLFEANENRGKYKRGSLRIH
jgi:predicted phage terminase large subunit-like protein